MSYVVRFEISPTASAYAVASHTYLVVRPGRFLVGHHPDDSMNVHPFGKDSASRFDTVVQAARALTAWIARVEENGWGEMWVRNPQLLEVLE